MTKTKMVREAREIIASCIDRDPYLIYSDFGSVLKMDEREVMEYDRLRLDEAIEKRLALSQAPSNLPDPSVNPYAPPGTAYSTPSGLQISPWGSPGLYQRNKMCVKCPRVHKYNSVFPIRDGEYEGILRNDGWRVILAGYVCPNCSLLGKPDTDPHMR